MGKLNFKLAVSYRIDSDWLVTSSRSKVRLRYRVKKQIKRTATKIIMMSPVNRLVSPTIIITSKTKSIANKSIDKIKLHKKATVSGVVRLGMFCGAFDYLGIDGVSNLVQYINQNILLAMMLSAMFWLFDSLYRITHCAC